MESSREGIDADFDTGGHLHKAILNRSLFSPDRWERICHRDVEVEVGHLSDCAYRDADLRLAIQLEGGDWVEMNVDHAEHLNFQVMLADGCPRLGNAEQPRKGWVGMPFFQTLVKPVSVILDTKSSTTAVTEEVPDLSSGRRRRRRFCCWP